MASYLEMDGSGSADLSAASDWQFGEAYSVFELYFRTTNEKAQALLSTQRQWDLMGGWPPPYTAAMTYVCHMQGSTLTASLDIKSTDPNCVWLPGVWSATCVLPDSLADGKWHQMAFLDSLDLPAIPDSMSFCVDGIIYPAKITSPLGFSPSASKPTTNVTSTILGQDKFFSPLVAPGFVGSITEIRLFSGGDGQAVVRPAWAPTLGAPVGVTAPNLKGYWPFWGNDPSSQMNDQVSGTPISLEGCTVQSSSSGIYNSLTELVLNVAPEPFPQFVAGQLEAFSFLMRQIPPRSDTPASFRALYSSGDTPFSAYLASIDAASMPEPPRAFSAADLRTVQKQLGNELTAVIALWNYYNSAELNAIESFEVMGLAAGTVQDAITNGGYETLSSSGTSILGTAFGIASGLASLAGLTPLSVALGNFWSVYSLFQSHDRLTYDPYPEAKFALESLYSDLSSAISHAQNGLLRAVTIVSKDWARLNMILLWQRQKVAFNAIAKFSKDANAKLEQASVLNFMVSVITSGNTIQDASAVKTMPDPFWVLGGEPPFFLNIGPGPGVAVAAHEGPGAYNGPPTTFLTTINDALPPGLTLSKREVFSWFPGYWSYLPPG